MRNPPAKLRPELFAYHEAGHAVSAWLGGLPVIKLELLSDRRLGGYASVEYGLRGLEAKVAEDFVRWGRVGEAVMRRLRPVLRMLLGGSAAQSKVMYEKYGLVSVVAKTGKFEELFINGSEHDRTSAYRLLRFQDRRDASACLMRQKRWLDVHLLGGGGWSAVEETAVRLQLNRGVEREEFQAICMKWLGPRSLPGNATAGKGISK